MIRSLITAIILGLVLPVAVSGALGANADSMGQWAGTGLICALVSWCLAELALHFKLVLWGTFAATLVWSAKVLWFGLGGLGILVLILGGFGFGFLTMWTVAVFVYRGVQRKTRLACLLPMPLLGQSVLLVLVPAFIALGVVPKVKFALSRDALESAATRVQAGEVLPVPDTIGVYRVRRIDRAGEAVRFLLWDVGLVDDGGLVYSPNGEPRRIGEDSYEHLDGPWWSWWQSW